MEEKLKMAKNKNVDAMISATGFIASFIVGLLAEIKGLGGSSEDVHRLVNPEGKTLLKQIAQLIVDAGKKAKQSFKITFDTALSFADMVKAGNYGYANPNITAENFSLDAEGKTEEEVFILHFDRDISSEQAIAEMDKQGLRPATITHALAFGSQHPEEQRKYPIVFLGSSWVDSDGSRRVPCLGVDGDERLLGLRWFAYDWNAGCRFAAVRK